ncbi:hypothetical protein B0H17DRAFT_682684 [Mycena rosella]|uniref:Uncharacterized protein n=1 Tax=Mycena rosella TaxID=1033263 RepID=A0AAD7DBD0_MYCRO|nr:hypothetical protein B0H17DRAFT_682684 [Mycena rosella]
MVVRARNDAGTWRVNLKKNQVTRNPNCALATTKMAPKPPPPPSTLTLRGDRDPHPGKPDKARTKRTTAEVQRDKAVKMAEKTAAAAKKKDGIDKAARVEDKLEAEDRANERDGNHPPPTTITKTLRPRPAKEASTAEQDPSTFSAAFETILTSSVSQAMLWKARILSQTGPAAATSSIRMPKTSSICPTKTPLLPPPRSLSQRRRVRPRKDWSGKQSRTRAQRHPPQRVLPGIKASARIVRSMPKSCSRR